MTPSEFLYHLKQLPADTPVTATHIAAILETLAPLLNQKPLTDFDSLPNSKLIDEEALAEWLGESPSSLQKWRLKGGGPRFVKGPKSVRYSVGAVRDWITSRTVNSTSEATVKGLSKLESMNSMARFSMPWSDPSPVMVADGKFVGFFRSLQEDIEIEPESFRMVRIRELSELHPLKLPNHLQEEAAPLLAALGEFNELIIKDPKKAREIYGEWDERLNDSVRFGFFVSALAFDLDFAKHIGTSFSPSFIADHFNPATWLWFLFVEHCESDLYPENLQWVFSYLSDMEVDINRATVIEDHAEHEVFSGTVAHLLADLTGEFFRIHGCGQSMQHYAPLVSTLLTFGLSVDLPNSGKAGITARQIGENINAKHGLGVSLFSAVLMSYELHEKLRSEMTRNEIREKPYSKAGSDGKVYELPSIFRLPSGEFHAASFS